MSGPARGRLQSVPNVVGRPRPRAQAHAASVALPQEQPLGPRAVEALVRLPDARWLDRLLRGRAWIALIAIGLIGLVFMQVSMLGMNAGIGQAVEKTDVLTRQNADMRREVSALSAQERIQREAAARGLVMPPAGDVRYLRSNGMANDAAKAAKTMRAPSDQAKATVAAAQAGATAVGSPLAGDTAPAPGVEGIGAATGAATAVDPAAQAQAQAPQTPQATQEAPVAQPQTQTQQPVTPQAQTQQAPAPTQQAAPTQQTQQAPPATTAGATTGATAAGAAAAPGN